MLLNRTGEIYTAPGLELTPTNFQWAVLLHLLGPLTLSHLMNFYFLSPQTFPMYTTVDDLGALFH